MKINFCGIILALIIAANITGCTFSKKKASQVVIVGYGIENDVQLFINLCRKAHPEIEIEVKDYKEYGQTADALKQLKIKDVDIALVAYGHNLESTIMTTALLKEIGVPRIIVRVDDDHYINIVKKVGADEIVSPQRAAGVAVCNRLVNEDFRDFYKLTGKYSVVLIEVNEEFEKTTLAELNAKKLYGVSVLLVIRDKDSFVPGGNDEILAGDNIYVVGTSKEIKAFRESINGKRVKK